MERGREGRRPVASVSQSVYSAVICADTLDPVLPSAFVAHHHLLCPLLRLIRLPLTCTSVVGSDAVMAAVANARCKVPRAEQSRAVTAFHLGDCAHDAAGSAAGI